MSKKNCNSSNAEGAATGIGLRFGLDESTLRSDDGPSLIDRAFIDWLSEANPPLCGALREARMQAPTDKPALSELLIEIGAELDTFIARLFSIEKPLDALRQRHENAAPLLRVKYKFVKRQALLAIEQDERDQTDHERLRNELISLGADPDDEPQLAAQVTAWQSAVRDKAPSQVLAARALQLAKSYAAWAAGTSAGRIRHSHGVLFDHPQAIDPLARIEHGQRSTFKTIPIHRIVPPAQHRRDGFDLTDDSFDLNGAMDQARYCLLCHKQGTDSCSHGLPSAKGSEKPFRESVTGEELSGCPLDERISEFLALKLNGHAIGALAMITLDNPMLAATGHRICNDCMKACVYQQQTPVDIPQAETRVLRDVLELPWGFEIYALLTRWNPLNLTRWVPQPATGKRILVVGAGPAGFTLAHHLLNDGHTVVAVDGLKIEPGHQPDELIRDAGQLNEALSERIAGGFGGVAEYGITVRWDKNFLTLIRLLLDRRDRFAIFGGIRFGGTLTTSDAWAMGFDHVALATGAGRPTLLNIPNGLAPGVRTASDFLMALQLTGAARADSLANLQIRLPVVVIGGGLTAMDTATEALAYYPVQVEKFLKRHEAIASRIGDAGARRQWSDADTALANEFIEHAHALRRERQRAQRAGVTPDFLPLLNGWGGVTIAYRKRLVDSPAYRLNPEEVANALAEGVQIAECVSPVAVQTDDDGQASAVRLERTGTDSSRDKYVELSARALFIAAGTHPNAILAQEEPDRYQLDGDYFAALNVDGSVIAGPGEASTSPIFCAHEPDGRKVSFLGDAHPTFAGNVVKAMASAKHAAPIINQALGELTSNGPVAASEQRRWLADLAQQLQARVHQINRLAPGILEVVVEAPAAARAFRPGQFYRLQNFEKLAGIRQVGNQAATATRMGMEGLAMTGAWIDKAAGRLGMIVLEMGGSSDLCADLRPGDPVIVMGPTGSPTEIVRNQTVLLIGGGLGNAVLFSIGAALRSAGSRVLYFAAYRNHQARFRPGDIEAASDHVIWCCDQHPGFDANRPGDASFTGNVVQAMLAHANGQFGNIPIAFSDVDRLITIGSDRMMAAVASARRAQLDHVFKSGLITIASINSPMQCMMKEICAQCLQLQRDPLTGQTQIVFSCVNQDQPMERVDFDCLAGRLAQNRLAEAQTRGWLELIRPA